MGLFNGPRLSKEEYERSVHLNLISRVNMLDLHNSELQAQLQVAQGRIEELEHDCEMRRATNIGQAQTLDIYANRIKELEIALKDAIEELRYAYIMGFSERYRDAARAAQKAFGKGEWDNLTAHPLTDSQRQLDEQSEINRHTNLVERLREHAENMYVDFLNDAADSLEAQEKRIKELEREIDDYETTYKGSVVEAQAKRIAELEAMLKLSADFASKQQSLGKEFEKVLFDNLDELYVVDPALEKKDA